MKKGLEMGFESTLNKTADRVDEYEIKRLTHCLRFGLVTAMIVFFAMCLFAERSFAQENNDKTETQAKKGGGLDPTKKKLFVRSEYRKLESGTNNFVFDTLYETPITPQWFLRVSMPFKRNSTSDGGENYGLGDFITRISYKAIDTDEGNRLFFGLENKWDTATDKALGSEKYTVSPLVSGFLRFPELKLVAFPSIQYVDTVGGDSARADSRNTTIKGSFVQILTDGYYLFYDPAFIWDHERNDQSTGTLDFEYGRFVRGTDRDSMYYIRPGTTLWGDSTPFSFKWNIELGVRFFM